MPKLLPEEYYRMENRAALTEAEARREFARLRHDVIRRRVERIQQAGLTDTPEYGQGMQLLSYVPSRMTDIQIRQVLSTAYDYVTGYRTVAEVRDRRARRNDKRSRRNEKISSALQAHGYNIKPNQVGAFGRYMQAWRSHPDLAGYDSGRVASLYDTLAGLGGLTRKGDLRKAVEKDFGWWISQQPRLEAYRDSHPDYQYTSAEDLRAAYTAWDDARR